MLDTMHQRGVDAALARFGIKSGAVEPPPGMLSRIGGGVKSLLIGQPGRAFVEGPRAFAPGGMLSHQNIWWPSVEGLKGTQKIMPWLQRAGTAMIPLQLMSAAHRDPNEGTLSNVLGAAGSIAGTMYGMPALGLLGAPILSGVGASVGHGIGHLLGSKPKDSYP